MFGTLLLAIARRVVPGAGQHGFGEIHAVADVAVLEEVAQRVGHHHGAVLLGLVRRGAEVRQRHDRG
jgi:hypothetical protein